MTFRVSHSAKDKYLGCPYSYYLYYNLKIKEEKKKSAFAFGASLDEGLNTLLDPETFNHELMDELLSKAKDKFLEEWEKHKDDALKFTKADLDLSLLTEEEQALPSHEQNWLSLKYKGILMLEAYVEQAVPKIKRVLSVQEFISIKNETDDELVGVIDLIVEWEDGRLLLIDNKTTSVTYNKKNIDESEQLATYEEAVLDKYNLDGIGYIAIHKNFRKKKLPKVRIQILTGEITEELHNKTFKKYDTVINGLRAGKFHKNYENCINKFGKCPYYNFCRNGSMEGLIDMSKEKKDK